MAVVPYFKRPYVCAATFFAVGTHKKTLAVNLIIKKLPLGSLAI